MKFNAILITVISAIILFLIYVIFRYRYRYNNGDFIEGEKIETFAGNKTENWNFDATTHLCSNPDDPDCGRPYNTTDNWNFAAAGHICNKMLDGTFNNDYNFKTVCERIINKNDFDTLSVSVVGGAKVLEYKELQCPRYNICPDEYKKVEGVEYPNNNILILNSDVEGCKKQVDSDVKAVGFTMNENNTCQIKSKFENKVMNVNKSTYIKGGNAQFTVSFWIYIDAVSPLDRVILKRGIESVLPEITIPADSTKLTFKCSTKDNVQGENIDFKDGDVSLKRWTLITTSVYGRNLIHYVDGVQVEKGTFSSDFIIPNNNSVITGNKEKGTVVEDEQETKIDLNKDIQISNCRILSIATPKSFIQDVFLNDAPPGVSCEGQSRLPVFCQVNKNPDDETKVDGADYEATIDGKKDIPGSTSANRGIRGGCCNAAKRNKRSCGMGGGCSGRKRSCSGNRGPCCRGGLKDDIIRLSGAFEVDPSKSTGEYAYLPTAKRPDTTLIFGVGKGEGYTIHVNPNGKVVDRSSKEMTSVQKISLDGIIYLKSKGKDLEFKMKRMVQYVKILQPKQVILNLAELEVYDNQDENIAKGKMVTVSSNYDGEDSTNINVGKAIDTNLNGNWPEDGLVSTGFGANQWIMIDLEKGSIIKKVVIHNRTDTNSGSIAGAKIQLLDQSKEVLEEQIWNPDEFEDQSKITINKLGNTCMPWANEWTLYYDKQENKTSLDGDILPANSDIGPRNLNLTACNKECNKTQNCAGFVMEGQNKCWLKDSINLVEPIPSESGEIGSYDTYIKKNKPLSDEMLELKNHNYCRNIMKDTRPDGAWCFKKLEDRENEDDTWNYCQSTNGDFVKDFNEKIYPKMKEFEFNIQDTGVMETNWEKGSPQESGPFREPCIDVKKNYVFLGGIIAPKNTNYKLPAIITQLDEQYRPSVTHLFNTKTSSGVCRIEVDKEGYMKVVSGTFEWISLDGIQWPKSKIEEENGERVPKQDLGPKLSEFGDSWKSLGSSEAEDSLNVGRVYKLMKFDGNGEDSGISVGDVPDYRITGSQTISMFVKATQHGRQNLIYKSWSGEGAIILEQNGTLSYYYGSVGDDSGETCEASATNCQGISSESSIEFENWNHVAVVRDTNVKKICWYINGALVSESEQTITEISTSNNDLVIGKGNQKPFKGQLSDIYMYNRALSNEEISAISSMKGNSENNFAPPSSKLFKEGGGCPHMQENLVVLSGVIGKKNPGEQVSINSKLVKLPASHRPDSELIFYPNANGESVTIVIKPNGWIYFQEGNQSISYISLDGIQYYTDK